MNFVQSRGISNVQDVFVSATTRIYKRLYNITRHVIDEFVDRINQGKEEHVIGHAYKVVKSNNVVQQISPNVEPQSE